MTVKNEKKFKILMLLLYIIIAIPTLLFFIEVLEDIVIYSMKDKADNYASPEDKLSLNDYHNTLDRADIKGNIHEISNDEYNYKTIEYAIAFKELITFPIELRSEKALYYNYIEKNKYRTDQRVELYLECQYDEVNFSQEVERIKKIRVTHENFGEYYDKYSVYVKDLFELPAYILCYNVYGKYSYALINNSSLSIIYIYLYDVESYDNIVFDLDYAPHKNIEESSFPKELIYNYGYKI